MQTVKQHTFHIPVLGVGYSIDTPINVAHYGISSVISLVDDALMEKMREFYCNKFDLPFKAISKKVDDFRAKRITSYLNVVEEIVNRKYDEVKKSILNTGSELDKFLDMLPEASSIKQKLNFGEKGRKAAGELAKQIKELIHPGSIDVNIMTKLDQVNQKDGEDLPIEYNDAHAALRGFAQSNLNSSLVLSAGMSPRLYSYIENFEDFYPDQNGQIKKKIILKVSDFRSALVQGKMLAAKGLWISEYRIESGVNCGGHAFPTAGVLFGPILEEFREKRDELFTTCRDAYLEALTKKSLPQPAAKPELIVTAQGGVGNKEEHDFLLDHYRMDSVGWGSPFMLVPEVISIDTETMDLLAKGNEDDYYFSGLSPLGVPFNSIKGASMSKLRIDMATNGKAGMPCTKGFLRYNTEYTEKPICTSSRLYQSKKLKELIAMNLSEEAYKKAYNKIIEPECLCIGLGVSTKMSKGMKVAANEKVTVCPGPNLAYFSEISTLKEMVNHIYGRINLLNETTRPNMFMKELKMYLDIFKESVEKFQQNIEDVKEKRNLNKFSKNLFDGIEYYRNLFGEKKAEVVEELDRLIKKYPVLHQEL
ncbi:hypothetical protein [Maribellus mangrovi]|uniref:hypothetical protein n=1 Tax=Maribellus mangrovi TaxID=3133146 RepID=UPI0030EC0CA8